MQVSAVLSPIFTGGEDILQTFLDTKTVLRNGDILAISSKIIALSQNRMLNIKDYGNNEKEALEEIIKIEADKIYPGKYTFTMKDGMLIPFAGIDSSNVPEGKLLLWPKNSYSFAKDLHTKLCEYFKIQDLGIIITDSRCQPLRWGVIGLSMVWYGFCGVEDVRGQKDLFGRSLEVTRKAVADNLASAAILVQGEGDECTPFAHIQNAPIDFSRKDDFLELGKVDPEEDIFKSVLNL